MAWNGFRLTGREGGAFDLIGHLEALPAERTLAEAEVRAHVGKDATLALRLIVFRKPADAAEETRKRLRAQASRKQRTLDPRTLVAAGFVILATSLAADYPAGEVLAVYRLRWQIELAFKRLKSLIHIDGLPCATERGARPWLQAHLILALLCDDVSQDFLASFPSGPDRGEISAVSLDSPKDRGAGVGRGDPWAADAHGVDAHHAGRPQADGQCTACP